MHKTSGLIDNKLMQGGWGKGVLIHQTFSGFKVTKLVKLITMKVVHDPQGNWENIQNKQ